MQTLQTIGAEGGRLALEWALRLLLRSPVLELLASRGMEDCLQLLHFHQGSQITNIRHIKAALTEASRMYTELVKRGAEIGRAHV